MSDKEIKEEVNDEEQAEAMEDPSNPASELVDLVLSGELHAANEKFNSIAESKVVTAIEDEKLKIAQTLFSEDEEPLEEAPKTKVKEDDDEDEDDEDDDNEAGEDDGDDKPAAPKDKEDEDDDSDSDDSDEGDDKPKKGKIPPQFMKKEEVSASEGVTGDDDANEKALAKNRAMAKKYGQVRQGIPADKKEEVKPEQSFDPGETSTNMPLPEYSFVAQVANHLSGNRGGYIKEDLARDIEAGFKKLSSKKAKAGKSDGFEGNAIKCGDYKITPVKYHDASDTTPGADESIAFHVYVEDGKGKAVTGKINASQGADAIDFETESGKFSSSDKKTAKEIEKWCNSN